MKTALTSYKEFAKEYKITEGKALPVVAQLSFARTQEGEQKTIINRLLVDLTKAQRSLDEAKDDATKEAYADQVSKYRKDLRQLSDTLDFFQELVRELEAEVDSETE